MNPIAAQPGTEPIWLRYLRHWILIAVVIGVFVVAALLVSLLRPPVHVAEARLAVGAGQMTALNIPGFPTASEQMASNYARWVGHQGAQGVGLPEGTLSLTASPIVESNVLRIEATSRDPETAQEAVSQAAEQLEEAVNAVREENDRSALVARIQDSIGPIMLARERSDQSGEDYREAIEQAPDVEVERLFEEYVDAQQELVALELERDGWRDRYRNLTATRSTEAELVTVLPAQVVGNDRMEVTQRNVLLALMAGLVLAGGTVHLLEHRARRARVPRLDGDAAEGDG